MANEITPEEAARWRKLALMFAELIGASQVGQFVVPALTDENWRLTAAQAGVRTPSAETIDTAKQLIAKAARRAGEPSDG